MNNEIKEILIQLEYFIEENYKYYNDFELNKNQIKQLLDYITNLQQKNEYLKKQNDEKTKIGVADHKYASQMEDKVIELQQENERLHENNQAMQEEMARVWEENERKERLITQYGEGMCAYANRIDKAIEYNNQIIKDTKDFYRPTTDIIYSGDVLIEIATNNINILQNGSDDNE